MRGGQRSPATTAGNPRVSHQNRSTVRSLPSSQPPSPLPPSRGEAASSNVAFRSMLPLAGRGSSVPGPAHGSNGESPMGGGRGAGDKWPVASECGGIAVRENRQIPAIYERPVVKRGGADFVSQGSRTSPSPSASVDLAHLRPVRGRFGVHPATHPLSPRPRESFLPQCRQCTKR